VLPLSSIQTTISGHRSRLSTVSSPLKPSAGSIVQASEAASALSPPCNSGVIVGIILLTRFFGVSPRRETSTGVGDTSKRIVKVGQIIVFRGRVLTASVSTGFNSR
jgi:hypothetical protein